MADMKKVATRDSYGNALAALGAEHENLVVLDADLAGATKTATFQKAFPERFIDCGIAEGNMIGVAAGLAATGKVPFASSFAMFAAGRAYEQIRNSVAYPKFNVKVCCSHAGVSVGEDGGSHQCIEDIALMRVIPGMTVICPADANEAKAATNAKRFFCPPDNCSTGCVKSVIPSFVIIVLASASRLYKVSSPLCTSRTASKTV